MRLDGNQPVHVNGFRFARIADELIPGAAGSALPLLSTERGFVDESERRRLLEYLRAAPIVAASDGDTPDLFDRAGRRLVRNGWRSDGTWIWSEAVEYYLDRYGVAPEPELRQWIVEHGYRPPAVGPATVDRAAESVVQWRSSMRVMATEDRDRAGFDPSTSAVLREGGWFPGRDVSGDVDAWLARLLAQEEVLAERPDALAAARALLVEFGGVFCQIHGAGRQRGLTPFGFYPDPDPDAELPDPFGYETLEHRVGVPLFPIGFAPEYRQLMVIAADGRVFLAGHAVDVLLGANPVEAITAMALGLTPKPVGAP